MIPYGYIYTYKSICRSTSVSAAVIQGILPGESAKLSTMWTMLGQPAASIAVPYWPVGKTPAEANGISTAPLCNIARQIKSFLFDYETDRHYIDSYQLLDGNGGGLWARTFPAEDSIFAAAEEKLDYWRTDSLITGEMLTTEKALAKYAHSILQRRCGVGYTSDWAADQFTDVAAKNDFYEAIGRIVDPVAEEQMSRFDWNSSPAEILDYLKS